MVSVPARNGGRPDRPRERLLALGAAALSDGELLALILRTGHAGRSVVDLSHQLLSDLDG
ncbi:MAG: UPF0758 domain-containing protein, partial [Thermoanaerobaculia bacterium]|nr:UPF0758 domain-containing protein [Thermoanaerobaculia bacterium]